MKKMIYFMNVDIKWIKQRPHYIAENLGKYYDLTVYSPIFYNRKILSERKGNYDFRLKRIFRLPTVIDYKFFHWLVDLFNGLLIKTKVRIVKPNYIYITSPYQVPYLPQTYEGIIIYDCMDDVIALAITLRDKKLLQVYENNLLLRTNIVLVSSCELEKVLLARYGNYIKEKILLVRNAYNGKINYLVDMKHECKREKYRICYFGTISSWFDIELISNSLEHFQNIEYILIGPIIENIKLPENERITYLGVIEHNLLWDYIQDVDCLFMPFVVNDVIKAVDPVKFYEYINFGKPIISVYYHEISRFEPFVYFYYDYDSYCAVLKNLLQKNVRKYSEQERILFLQENSWKKRCEIIIGAIEENNTEILLENHINED